MQAIKSRTKMRQTVIFLLVCVVQSRGDPEQHQQKCSQWCICENSVIQCQGGGIPQLQQNITRFQLQNAEPPILDLSPSIITHLQHLVFLNIDGAGLRSIQPGTLGLMDHLEELSLTNNNITLIENDTFTNCSSLMNLMLDNNNIKVIMDGAFVPLQRLQKLSLSHNHLSTLPTLLPPQIHQLSLHHNFLHEAHLNLPNLTSLNLCYNLITNIDPKQMNVTGLKEICLGGSKFNPNNRLITKEQFPVLESLQLKGFSEYNTLDIADNTLEDIKVMSTISLHTLELDLCSISSFNAFGKMSKLHTLKLINTTQIVTRMFPTKFVLPPITVLDFYGSPGLARAFLTSPFIKHMTSVEVLRMSRCAITTLPLSIKEKLPNIMHLDLSHNPIHCTCDLSWISDHVREGKLIIENEMQTLCAIPKHLQGITMLTATLCPFVGTPTTETAPKLTVPFTGTFNRHTTTPVSFLTTLPATTFPEESTEIPGKISKPIGRSLPTSKSIEETPLPTSKPIEETPLPTSKPIEETSGLGTNQLIFVIVGSILIVILTVYILMMLGNYLRNRYRARNFSPVDVSYSSQQRLTLHRL